MSQCKDVEQEIVWRFGNTDVVFALSRLFTMTFRAGVSTLGNFKICELELLGSGWLGNSGSCQGWTSLI